MNPTQVVILAGGLGTRLRPLTYDIPKPMAPIHGRPYLEFQFDYLKRFSLTKALLLVGYLGNQISDRFGDGSNYGMQLDYSVEETPIGTGGGLKLAEEKIEDLFFLIYGDSFLPIDLMELESCFRKSKAEGMMVVYDNSENTSVPENVEVDAEGRVVRYEKKERGGDLNYVEAGLLMFRKEVLRRIPEGRPVSFEEEIFPELIAEGKMAAFVTSRRFYDIGTPERLEDIARFFNKEGE